MCGYRYTYIYECICKCPSDILFFFYQLVLMLTFHYISGSKKLKYFSLYAVPVFF